MNYDLPKNLMHYDMTKVIFNVLMDHIEKELNHKMACEIGSALLMASFTAIMHSLKILNELTEDKYVKNALHKINTFLVEEFKAKAYVVNPDDSSH